MVSLMSVTIVNKGRVFCPICNEFTDASFSFTKEEANYQCQKCHTHFIYKISKFFK